MPQKSENPKPYRLIFKRIERVGLLFLAVFIFFGLCDMMTGTISGGYPFIHRVILERESEGKQYVGAINRTQQEYFLKKGKFAKSVAGLELGISTDTTNYHYEIVPQTDPNQTIAVALAKSEDLKSFAGAMRVITQKDGKRTTIGILCEPERSPRNWLFWLPKQPTLPYYSKEDNDLHCGEGSKPPNS